jgi:hypothetical protein
MADGSDCMIIKYLNPTEYISLTVGEAQEAFAKGITYQLKEGFTPDHDRIFAQQNHEDYWTETNARRG